MASYAITPVQSELKMTLYNKEVYAGPDINGVTIINRQPMGTTWVFSWPVTDGPAANANIVGHLQGTGVQVANNPKVILFIVYTKFKYLNNFSLVYKVQIKLARP
jgi:hypothetical protein